MKSRWLLAFAFTVVTTGTLAQQPPFAFKDLVLGQPVGTGEVAQKLDCALPSSCNYSYRHFLLGDPAGPGKLSDAQRMERLRQGVTIGGALAQGVSVELAQDKIDQILVTFTVNAYEKVRDGLKEKYPSLSCEKSVTQNRMGATFDQENCTATDATGTLLLARLGGDIETSSLMISSNARLQRHKESDAKARSDL